MESPQEILRVLDFRFGSIDMPCFGNLNIDYVYSRLLAFRDKERWMLVFNSIVWWPASDDLEAMVECVGNCVVRRQGFNHATFYPGEIEFSESGELLKDFTATVRGKHIPSSELRIEPQPELYGDDGFWVAVALLENYKEELLASSEEYGTFIPSGLTEVLRLDEWHRPDWNCLPSQTESFPLIAQVLTSGDPTLYRPPRRPNTHWRHWLPK